MLSRFLNKLDMCLGRCSVYVLLTCRLFSVLYFVFRLMLIANWDIVQQLAKFGYVCGMQCIK